jgi:hypothetical protein
VSPPQRIVVLDHTRLGDASASGELKATILASWPTENLLQVYDSDAGVPQIAGRPVEPGGSAKVAADIAAFDPDLILYRPVPDTAALHELAVDVIARTNTPLALWIVDDWLPALALRNPAAGARMDADFRWLLDRADVRFSISQAMSDAFLERYGYTFIPIANGVDPADWPEARPRPPGPVRVRYAGSLAANMTLASVELVARVVEELAESGLDISLEIRSRQHFRAQRPGWVGLRHTTASASDLSIADYRRWLTEADILLIAYNFDERSREYVRYSLANKLPECLASGAAVFAVGPDDVGTMATLAALDVGARVTVADERLIGEALRRLATAPHDRLALARRAQAVAFSRFDVRETRRTFEAAVAAAVDARPGPHPRDAMAKPPARPGSASRPNLLRRVVRRVRRAIRRGPRVPSQT